MAFADQFAIPASILRHFDISASPWIDDSVAGSIEQRRQSSPGEKLFYDRLLEIAGIDGPSVYPPRNPADMRRLLHSIDSTDLDRLKKDCYFYYLLKDFDAQPKAVEVNGYGEGDEMDLDSGSLVRPGDEQVVARAVLFAKKRCMPSQWRLFIDGYWSLDHGLWEDAVGSLSDPSISEINFIPEIVKALSSSVSPPRLASALLHSLLLTTQTELPFGTPENEISVVATASAASLSEAFTIIRRAPDAQDQSKLREAVWCWALGAPKTPCGQGSHPVQPKALRELLHIPLLPSEETHLIDFLSRPSRTITTTVISQLHDLVTLRLIHQGNYSQALQLDKQLAGSAGKQEDKERRREIVRGFISVLPEVHRRLLLADLESGAGKQMVNGNTEDVDMGWIDGIVDAHTSVSTPPVAVPAQPFASTPVRSASSSSLAHISRPAPQQASPAPERVSSPFHGPPRFAAAPDPSTSTSSPRQTQAFSGSPFSLPPKSAAALAQKAAQEQKALPKKVVNDDAEEEEALLRGSVRGKGKPSAKQGGMRRSARQSSKSLEPEELDENHPIEPIAEDIPWSPPAETLSRSTKRASSIRRETRATVSPPPVPSARRSTRARQSVAAVEDDGPPARRTRGASAHPEPPTPARSRMTRSVSRALADFSDDESVADLPPRSTKKTAPASTRKKRGGSVAASEVTEDVDRATELETPRAKRTRRNVASPTPSAAGSEVGKGRKTKEVATRTPRMATRSRKA
ncbi:hypothetical protein I350_01470 [Cryptococcus amylolentus CBS 6273]|uniref:ELYS-like domain-containing protein n=1 Tax=Cryptococcus amylolentus CBS 6273 TaxID=1296118 RepID=A0A1E3KCN7_9TREE|nr:hypothetical protein I350_01470 [Cryptococcus amylolentus CBS 6273]